MAILLPNICLFHRVVIITNKKLGYNTQYGQGFTGKIVAIKNQPFIKSSHVFMAKFLVSLSLILILMVACVPANNLSNWLPWQKPTATPTQAPTATMTATTVERVFVLQSTQSVEPTPTQTAIIEPPLHSPTPMDDPSFEVSMPLVMFEEAPPFRQQADAQYLPYFADLARGCNIMAVAGQVFNCHHQEMLGVVISVYGELDGRWIDLIGLTGAAQAYGPGGFELVLAEKPIYTTQSLFIQLFDQNGQALSAPFAFDTSAICEANLILINFEEIIIEPLPTATPKPDPKIIYP